MFLRSLQWRLVSFFCLIAICLVVPLGIVLNKKVEESHYNNFILGINNGLKYWNLADNPNPSAQDIIAEFTKNDNAYLFYIIGDNRSYTIFQANDNKVIKSSDSQYKRFGEDKFTSDLMQSENFLKGMAGKYGNGRRLESSNGKEYFDYAQKKGSLVLYFRYYKDEWQNTITDFNIFILKSLGIALMAAFVLGYMLSRTITVPIVKIMNRANNIAGGNFDKSLEVNSNDEIGNLTGAFNYMAENLKNTLAEISSAKNKTETILNYMTDAVIAFNIKGEVIHINPKAKKILGVIDTSFTFNDYASKYGLAIRMEDVLYLESFNTEQVQVNSNDRTFMIYFAIFRDEVNKPDGIIAVLHDITEQHKLETMRREFVANVSHELRTPLTSIKSYTETLLDGVLEDKETAEQFLGVIDSEADRMTRLVKDLLQLSSLENEQMKWNMKDIRLDEIVKASVEKMRLEAKNKDQKLESYVIGNIPTVYADADRIEQVVLNIISNSIKYTMSGGIITTYVGILYSEVYIKIVDNGIGIPEEDLPRIFERFYRVDKARSRQMGGTGLGLAIAKEIIEAHQGQISISSEFGKGTEVTIRFPRNEIQNKEI
jgi:two-component system sensor histidine kinase VicK